MPHTLLVGTVCDPAGQPVAGARVMFTVSPAPMPDLAALTGADGRFTLSLPLPGHYEIAVHADGFLPKTANCQAGAGGSLAVEIALRK